MSVYEVFCSKIIAEDICMADKKREVMPGKTSQAESSSMILASSCFQAEITRML